MVPSQWRAVRFQVRADLADPAAILDVRVRRALAHAFDRQALVDVLTDGQELPSDSFLHLKSGHWSALANTTTKFPSTCG
jgi:ABC-type transport system substrate-binding protein